MKIIGGPLFSDFYFLCRFRILDFEGALLEVLHRYVQEDPLSNIIIQANRLEDTMCYGLCRTLGDL